MATTTPIGSMDELARSTFASLMGTLRLIEESSDRVRDDDFPRLASGLLRILADSACTIRLEDLEPVTLKRQQIRAAADQYRAEHKRVHHPDDDQITDYLS